VPTLDEAVPGYESTNFYGIATPRGTPDDVIAKLNSEINAGLDNVDVRSRLATLGIVPRAMSSAEFGNFVAAETEKWGKVIRTAGLKAE
jgi:tripartite-type tricarboxylate transporter receptor subunit TctC